MSGEEAIFLKWLAGVSYPLLAGKLNLSVVSAAYSIYGLSLIFQSHRWGSTPAYHVLLLIFRPQAWAPCSCCPAWPWGWRCGSSSGSGGRSMLMATFSIDRPPEAPAGDQQEMSDYPADRG